MTPPPPPSQKLFHPLLVTTVAGDHKLAVYPTVQRVAVGGADR